MGVRRLVVALAAALIMAVVAPGTASAALDMFLKVDGIPGESHDRQHRGEIDVLAWSWGLSNPANVGSEGSGKVSAQNFSFTKYLDRSSPILLQHVASGRHVANAVLTVRHAGEQPVDVLKMCFTNVVFTSLSAGGSGGEDRLTENVTFAFSQLEEKYTPQNESGLPGPPIWGGWDFVRNIQYGNREGC
jgi:type VI secretion system secreted protein Hcp